MRQKVARRQLSAARRFDFLTEQSFHEAESLLSCLFRCALIRSSHAGYNVAPHTKGLKRDMSFTVTGASTLLLSLLTAPSVRQCLMV